MGLEIGKGAANRTSDPPDTPVTGRTPPPPLLSPSGPAAQVPAVEVHADTVEIGVGSGPVPGPLQGAGGPPRRTTAPIDAARRPAGAAIADRRVDDGLIAQMPLTATRMGLNPARMTAIDDALAANPGLRSRLGVARGTIDPETLLARLNAMPPDEQRFVLGMLAMQIAASRVQAKALRDPEVARMRRDPQAYLASFRNPDGTLRDPDAIADTLMRTPGLRQEVRVEVLRALGRNGQQIDGFLADQQRTFAGRADSEARRIYATLGGRGELPPVGNTVAPAERQELIDAGAKDAVRRFEAEVVRIRGLDAASLARAARDGRPIGEGLNDEQRRAMTNAIGELLLDMPAGALSPDLATWIDSRTGGELGGVVRGDTYTTKVRDLTRVPAAVAQRWAAELEHDHPTTYAALETVGYAILAGAAYGGGSRALRDLGVRPEASTKLLNGKVAARIGGAWGAAFAEPELRASVDGRTSVGETKVDGGISVDGAGPRLSDLGVGGVELRAGAQHDGVRGQVVHRLAADATGGTRIDVAAGGAQRRAGVGVDLDGGGAVSGYRAYGSAQVGPDAHVEGAARLDARGTPENANARISLSSLGVGVAHDFQRNQTAASVTWSERYDEDAMVVLDAEAGPGQLKVGIGLRWSF